MDFSKAIRELFIGDSLIFFWAYIGIAICAAMAFSGMLFEFLYFKKIKSEKFFGIFEILIRILFISLGVVVTLDIFKIDTDSVVKTPVGRYYFDQTQEIKEMNPKEIEEEIDAKHVQELTNSGVYTGIKEVRTDKAYYEIEKWEVKDKRLNPVYIIVEKGTLN